MAVIKVKKGALYDRDRAGVYPCQRSLNSSLTGATLARSFPDRLVLDECFDCSNPEQKRNVEVLAERILTSRMLCWSQV